MSDSMTDLVRLLVGDLSPEQRQALVSALSEQPTTTTTEPLPAELLADRLRKTSPRAREYQTTASALEAAVKLEQASQPQKGYSAAAHATWQAYNERVEKLQIRLKDLERDPQRNRLALRDVIADLERAVKSAPPEPPEGYFHSPEELPQ